MKKLFITLLLCFASLGALENANAQMFWNHAVSFAGNTSSYMRIRPTAQLNLTGSFTLEAWVYPTFNSSNMVIMSKGVSCSYGLKLSSRRPTIVTNNIPRLISKTSSVLPLNEWSHVAGVFNSSLNRYDIYINGSLDTSGFTSNPPASNTDSLYIGKQNTLTYWGMMDDIRIWNKSLTAAQVRANYRTSLNSGSTPSTAYSGLVLLLTGDNSFSENNPYNMVDATNNSNPVFSSNITPVSMIDKQYSTISPNQSLEFNGGDYASANSTGSNDVSSTFTMEAWIYLRSYNSSTFQPIIYKGNSLSTGYKMRIGIDSTIQAGVNGNLLGSGSKAPLNTWTHITFSQNSSGVAKLYVNGILKINFTIPVVAANTDSLYVGGLPTGEGFDGYIDEVRISLYEKSITQIKDYMYTSFDRANDLPGNEAVYNLDGGLNSSTGLETGLNLRKNTKFSNPNTTDDVPISPLLRYDSGNFQKGYRMKTANKRIPSIGTSGLIFDTIYVNPTTTITDLNVFLGINHTYDGDIEATLFAPNGDSARIIFDRYTTTQQTGDIISIFDDQADSSLVNGRYTSFMPRIKPEQNFNSIFGGDNPQGNWVLRINDDASGDTGMLYAWGIQLNGETLVGVEDPQNNSIPSKFSLEQNYPNPFNPSTAIKFSIPAKLNVKLRVYDITGREVATLVNNELASGAYEFLFDGSKLSSGVYFYKLEAGEFIDTKKMILVK